MYEYASTFDGYMTCLYNTLRNNAQKRTIPISVEITRQDIIDLYHQQNGKLTGFQMSHTRYELDKTVGHRYYYNISVDPNLPYTKDNIQLVCSIINNMKWDYCQKDFIETCRAIKNHHKHLSIQPQLDIT